MSKLREMIAAHPQVCGAVNEELTKAAVLAAECAAVARACADSCLGEPGVADLLQCIRLNLDCADMAWAFSGIASRCSGGDMPLVDVASQACEAACRRSAVECRKHAAMHEHCRICAEVCTACADACHALRQSLEGSARPAAGRA